MGGGRPEDRRRGAGDVQLAAQAALGLVDLAGVAGDGGVEDGLADRRGRRRPALPELEAHQEGGHASDDRGGATGPLVLAGAPLRVRPQDVLARGEHALALEDAAVVAELEGLALVVHRADGQYPRDRRGHRPAFAPVVAGRGDDQDALVQAGPHGPFQQALGRAGLCRLHDRDVDDVGPRVPRRVERPDEVVGVGHAPGLNRDAQAATARREAQDVRVVRAEQDATDVRGMLDEPVFDIRPVVQPVTAQAADVGPAEAGVVEDGRAVEHGHAHPGVAQGEAPEVAEAGDGGGFGHRNPFSGIATSELPGDRTGEARQLHPDIGRHADAGGSL